VKIHGERYTRQQVLERIGHLAQIGGTRRCLLNEGGSKGVEAIEVDTGSGFHFTVLPDRGMDISRASFRGINLVFTTPNGEVHPSFYEPEGLGWLRTFFGGLLTTCGLTYLGAPSTDGKEELGLHGRYSCIPACKVNDLSAWEGDEYRIRVSGVMKECCLFGHKIRLTRTISSTVGDPCLTITDDVENVGYEPAPFMIMYHVNPGFPLLNASSQLLLNASHTRPFDAHAESGMSDMLQFSEPVPGFREMCYVHTMTLDKDGMASAAFVNPELEGGLGLSLRFDGRELPHMTEWKMMGQGDYVVGFEPCNVPFHNRSMLREKGILPMLAPGEKKHLVVEIGVLVGVDEIERFRKSVSNA